MKPGLVIVLVLLGGGCVELRDIRKGPGQQCAARLAYAQTRTDSLIVYGSTPNGVSRTCWYWSGKDQ